LVGVLLFLFFQNFIFLRNPMLLFPFFRRNMIVVTIASNYGRYNVMVFPNAPKRHDFHQHTAYSTP
jgi:hypothetical protein